MAPAGDTRQTLVVAMTGPSSQSQRPPSGDAARILTLLAAFWLWFLLPVAVHFQRKARREVEVSDGAYVRPRTIWNRPILLWFTVLASALALVIAMAVAGVYGS